MKSVVKKITPFISILFFGLAVWFLEHELRQQDLGEVARRLSDVPLVYAAFSLFLSFLSYLILTGYDGLGIKYIGEKLSASRIVRAGFISYAFSHNIGLALITGGSIRYRIYSAWGLSGIQVTQVVAFSALTLWIGFCSVAGLSLVFATPELPDNVSFQFIPLRILGYILLAMVIGYLWGSARINKEITFKGHSFTFPDFSIALQQIILASIDWLLAASVLYVLLPVSGINFFSFTGIFLLAQIIGLFSQVPGGLGVFESVMLVYLSNFMTSPTVLSILMIYRIIYYIIPLIVAMVLLGYQEYVVNHRVVKDFGQRAINWFPTVVPQLMSILVFIGGAMLLFTGAVPAEIPQVQWLQRFLPLPLIEMSHFLASLVGAALLVLARGIQRRIDAAYHLTFGLVAFGVLFSLLRGADYIEATILLLMLVALLTCRKEFYRKASLLAQPLSTGWIAIILIVIFSSIWLGIFSYWNVEYQNELWWQFTFLGDAPRYLRASVGVLAVTLLYGLIKLLKPNRQKSDTPKKHEIEIAENIVATSDYANAHLVFLKDKELLFNENLTAFVMYAIDGRSWISMGDPVGNPDDIEDLIWEFRALCDENDAWPVFYQVRQDYLNYYSDLGLTRLKLGEEARIPLQSFDSRESIDEELLVHHKGLSKSDYSFDVIARERVPDIIPRLKTISDDWLNQKKGREKRFSLGRFDPDYLRHFPVGLVRRRGEIVAFTNIWRSAGYQELSTDLFRYQGDTDEYIVDYMLIETMLWGKEKGFEWFNLGMAPLSGMESQVVTGTWNKVADLVFTYGENFYNFKQIREYKSRYNPIWEPKYLICPGGLAIPGVISSLTSKISGGIKGLVS